MIGGMVSSTVLTLLVIPAIYSLWKERTLTLAPAATPDTPANTIAAPNA
jgi:Cu(I)/Ag(I) efflux system membrane protein CusA/SilA